MCDIDRHVETDAASRGLWGVEWNSVGESTVSRLRTSGNCKGLVTQTAMEAISVSIAFSYSIRKKDKELRKCGLTLMHVNVGKVGPALHGVD